MGEFKPVKKGISQNVKTKIVVNIVVILIIIASMVSLGFIENYNVTNMMISAREANIESTNKAEESNKVELTETKIEINNTELSTLTENENVQILATLKSDENEENNLYKNPIVEIKLPEELEKIDIHSIRLLNGEGLNNIKTNYDEETKTIVVKIEEDENVYKSKIEEGFQVAISAGLTFKKDTPSKESVVSMICTNEEGTEEPYEISTAIKLDSKYGAILYNKISDYNEEKEVIETIEDGVVKANLQPSVEARTVSVQQSFTNNYNEPIKNVTILGRLTSEDNEEQIEEISAVLLKLTATNKENAKVYYSKKEDATIDDESWTESFLEAMFSRSYKIEIEELQPGEQINIDYQVLIAAGTENGQKVDCKTEVTYYYKEQELKNSSTIELATPEITKKTVLESGIKIDYLAESQRGNMKAGDQIFEGETIQYTVTVKNTSGKDLNNVELIAEHSNAVYYVTVGREAEIPEGDEPEILYNTKKDEEARNVTKTLERLANNESATFTYILATKKRDGNEVSGKITIKADELEVAEEIATDTYTIKDSKLTLDITNGQDENVKIYEQEDLPYLLSVTNNSEKALKNIILKVKLSDNQTLKEKQYDIEGNEKIEIVSNDNNEVTLKISELDANAMFRFILYCTAGEMDKSKLEDEMTIFYTGTVENETYFSRTITRPIYRKDINVTGEQFVNVEQKMLRDGDKLIYSARITNNDPLLAAENMSITQSVTLVNAKIEKGQLIANGGTINANVVDTNRAIVNYSLQPGETIEYVSEVAIWENPSEGLEYQDHVTSSMELKWGQAGYLQLEDIVSPYTRAPEGFGEPEKDTEVIEPEDPTGSTDPTPGGTTENPGSEDSNDTEAGSIVENEATNENKNTKFDLSLNKSVSKITIKNSEGTKEQTYNKEKLVKAEIPAKQLDGSTITIEYLIEVKNEGDIPGFVEEIIDYKPSELDFNESNNNGWQLGNDGNLHNTSLANNSIAAGETKQLALTLTKKLSSESTGTIRNTAEIAVASNQNSVADSDSTPGNKKDGEDDMSTAQVIISVKTGLVTISFTILIIGGLIVTAYIIYKKRKEGPNEVKTN